MKKLELKNLKVKNLTDSEKSNVVGGLREYSAAACTSTYVKGTACGDTPSCWPLACGTTVRDCSGGNG